MNTIRRHCGVNFFYTAFACCMDVCVTSVTLAMRHRSDSRRRNRNYCCIFVFICICVHTRST